MPLSDQITKIDSFVIRKGDTFVFDKVEVSPIYIGYKDEIVNTLVRNTRPPGQFFEGGLSVIVVASFVVDKSGKMKSFQIVLTSSLDVNKAAFDAFKKIEGEWSPAICNGQPIDSQVFIIFDIKPQGAPSTLPNISNAIVVPLQYYGVKRTVQVSKTVISSGPGYPRRE